MQAGTVDVSNAAIRVRVEDITRTWGCGPGIRRTASATLVVASIAFGADIAGGQAGTPVLYGDSFLLSGEVEDGGAGQLVVVLGRRHGRGAFAELGRVRTSGGGRWRYTARPVIRTVYRARVGELLSTPVVVDVEPRILLRGNGGRFTASVRAARPLAGKFVVLQRRTNGAWSSVRRLVLDRSSSTRFVFRLPRVRTEIRLFMPRSQVGSGYVAARSTVFTLVRR